MRGKTIRDTLLKMILSAITNGFTFSVLLLNNKTKFTLQHNLLLLT